MLGVIQVWSDGKSHAKANKTPGSSCSSVGFSGQWMALSYRKTLSVCEPCIPTTVMIMALFILGAFSFIFSSVKMRLLDPFPTTGGNREHWTGRMGSKIFRKQDPGDQRQTLTLDNFA